MGGDGVTGGRRARAVAGLASCAVALGAPPASAAPAWLPSIPLSAAANVSTDPQVAMAPDGDAVAVWTSYNGARYVVQAAVRPAGGAFAAPVDLSAAGESAYDPQVAIDPAGDAIVVWSGSTGANYVVRATTRPAGGTFAAAVDLSAAGQDAGQPQVALDDAGGAIAVWERSNGTDSIVQAAVRPAGGTFTAPVDLSLAGRGAYDPQVALDRDGDAIAVWKRFSGTNFIVQAAVRPAGGTFAGPTDLSAAGRSAQAPQVAIDQDGDAIAVWERSNGANLVVQAAVRPAGGTFAAPVDLSAAGENGQDPQVAVGQAGKAVCVWRRSNGTNMIVQASLRPAGGAFAAPRDLSSAGQDTSDPQVAIDPDGDATAVWHTDQGVVRAAARPAGGEFAAAVALSAAGQTATQPRVAIDRAGDAISVWRAVTGLTAVVHATPYDAAGPQLRGVSVPATGVVGVPATFAASPFDVWSALGATTWAFGDGTTATGTTTTHAYATAGTFGVSVSAADALGNTTTASRAITIAPARSTPPPPPPPLAALSALRVTPAAFGAARSGASIGAAAATGAQVSYTLNVAAGVRFTVQRASSGRRAGKSCAKQTSANRKRRRCVRYAAVPGSFARSSPAGPDRFRFSGRLANRALKPGRYRLLATPTANARAGATASADFRIVTAPRRKRR